VTVGLPALPIEYPELQVGHCVLLFEPPSPEIEFHAYVVGRLAFRYSNSRELRVRISHFLAALQERHTFRIHETYTGINIGLFI
jgi:hypothetical protein